MPIRFHHLILFGLIFLLFGCKNTTSFSESVSIDTNDFYRNATETLISAHRGGSGIHNYPENCVATLDYLYKHDVQVFEIDVFQTVDDELMLLHDGFLERTTTGNGKVKGKTKNELKQYDLVDDYGKKTNYKIPTLEEVFEWAEENEAQFMIDIKASASYEKIIDLIRDHDMEYRCVLISYNVAQAKKLYHLAPEMLISVSTRNMRELEWILKTNIPHENMIAFTGTRLSEEELYSKLNELNIPSILGTLGNLDNRAKARGDELYKEWADLGISILATDRPLQALKAVQ